MLPNNFVIGSITVPRRNQKIDPVQLEPIWGENGLAE